ncbi:DNA-processing protein DprA [Streptomyces sp. KLOTTS4A1]|uniref:DNA-processing protein DprA n=1 Tax=Streptomyces sp. KLOTTS4A1 TaxID=3390996 RepID=UPI0039F46130
MHEEERLGRLALARAFEPGDEHAGRWLRSYGVRGTIERITAQDESLNGVKPARLIGLDARLRAARPEHDLEASTAAGARFVIPGDAEWPLQLDDLGDARPVGLWVRGRPSLRIWALRSVSVVGSRACTAYGAHMAQTLAADLAARGWIVVSGGAYGIDAAAHRGALCEGGATIAVLACGVDHVYPSGHRQLFARIGEQGLLVGELPPGSHPTRFRFIQRNRVIAALTRGTVAVEAALRSGALITVRRAQALGRHTMGVPGPATSGLSAGVHQLLRGEGTLVTEAAEVIEQVGGMGELAPERRGPILPRDLLDPRAARVLEAVPARGAVAAEGIARAAQTDVDEAVGRLYELQSLGFVERHGDGWKLTRQAPGPSARGERGAV